MKNKAKKGGACAASGLKPTNRVSSRQKASRETEAFLGASYDAEIRFIRDLPRKNRSPLLTRGQKWELIKLRSAGAEQELLESEGGVISAGEFAELLGLPSRHTTLVYLRAGRIFAVSRNARNRTYPAWQVHAGQLLPGLAEILAELRTRLLDPIGIMNFHLTEAHALGNRRPLDLLREGIVDPVRLYAKSYGLQGA